MAFSPESYTVTLSLDGTSEISFPATLSSWTKGSMTPMTDKQQKASAAIRDLDPNEREAISNELKAIEAKRKAEIVAGLKAVVDLEKLKKPSGRRFVLAYWKDDEHHVVQGIDFAYSQDIDEDDETDERRVFLSELEHYAVGYEHYTMKRLRERLDSQDYPYHIAYLSE